MELFHVIFHVLVIFGSLIRFSEAGLITPLGGMSSISFRPVITTGYLQNSPILRQPAPGLTYINPVSPAPVNGGNQWFFLNRPVQNGVLTQNPWYLGTTPIPIFNIPTDVPKTDTTPDYDKILAERFPGAFKLLDELKNLNKIKEEEKGLISHVTAGVSDAHDKSIFSLGKEEQRVTGTGASTHNGRWLLKKLTKKKFFQQAQPVRPENEKPKTKDVVYYVDT
ncbi:unnamed protein product [Chrysodeixis includens]|uniref:Uncharacterized protein n=1 Tax=Chrysodeixis includens TaxID=689277 RepID=A0A9P0C0G2_CHRIL|nr:unnamed protein product [Chrysodeixis includens]